MSTSVEITEQKRTFRVACTKCGTHLSVRVNGELVSHAQLPLLEAAARHLGWTGTFTADAPDNQLCGDCSA